MQKLVSVSFKNTISNVHRKVDRQIGAFNTALYCCTNMKSEIITALNAVRFIRAISRLNTVQTSGVSKTVTVSIIRGTQMHTRTLKKLVPTRVGPADFGNWRAEIHNAHVGTSSHQCIPRSINHGVLSPAKVVARQADFHDQSD
jgi:hypothetical protein